jgi:hypothetical protein
LALLCGL